MKLASALEKGINGATTLSLLQNAISKIDSSSPLAGLLSNPGTLKKIKKQSKKGNYPAELYVRLATDLISGASRYGLSGWGKKKNAVWIGGLLGASAGMGHALIKYDDSKTEVSGDDHLKVILMVALYTSVGLLTGATIKCLKKSSKKKKKK